MVFIVPDRPARPLQGIAASRHGSVSEQFVSILRSFCKSEDVLWRITPVEQRSKDAFSLFSNFHRFRLGVQLPICAEPIVFSQVAFFDNPRPPTFYQLRRCAGKYRTVRMGILGVS